MPRDGKTHSTGQPQPIGDVLGELLARRGYGRVQSAARLAAAWSETVGPAWSPQSWPGSIRRGVLEVCVANSTLLQEMSFQKAELLAGLVARLPDERIRDLRFRVGS